MNEARTARPRRLTSVGAPQAWPCGRAHLGHGFRDVGRGPRRKERDDVTVIRALAAVGTRGRRGTGRSRVTGWASTTPRRRRGARAQTGWGHPGARGERRDSGLWLARRSPSRASVAGSPPGKQVRKQWPISARVSVPALPRMPGPAFSRQLDTEGSHRFAAPTGHRFPRTPGKGDRVKVEGESSPAASREATCGLGFVDLTRAPPAADGVRTAGLQGPTAFAGGR